MKEVSIEDIKSKFFEYSSLLQSPLNELEKVWDFIQRVFLDRYPRIRFWVADPQDKKYYGFRSKGMGREFEKKFDCKGYNPFEVRKYPVGFDEVPKDLKHPIEGDEEDYILKYELLDAWCKKGNLCPEYIKDIEYGIKIDEAVTIHIPHRLSRKTPLGAISLDFGEKKRTFNKNEVNILISLIGTFLRDVITPLIETELVEARKKIILANGISTPSLQSSVSPSTYKLPNPRYGLIVYNDEDISHPFVKKNGVFELIEKAANSTSCVLILGETGTGKQLCAEAIHKLSTRCKNPLIETNLGKSPSEGISTDLELFGGLDNKGNVHQGLFELANGSSLFLDEIGEAEERVQKKLLKVLDKGLVEPVGLASRAKTVDVRVIAATNRDIDKLLEKGSFRKDLYFRLNVISITLSPLKERLSDLLPLMRFFTRRKCVLLKNKSVLIDPKVLKSLFAYDWPGNIRELENMIEHIIVLANANIDPVLITMKDLPERIRTIQIESAYFEPSPILLYKPEKPFEQMTANELQEIANRHIEGLKREGRKYLDKEFPLDQKDNPQKKAEFKTLLDCISYDRKKWVNMEINDVLCSECGKVNNYLECNDYKKHICNLIIPSGTFADRWAKYGCGEEKQGRPKKKNEKNELNSNIDSVHDSVYINDVKRDKNISSECMELLKEVYREDQIEDNKKTLVRISS